jgi:hypothetical protein
MRSIGLLVLLWLMVGGVAAGQRGYLTHATQDCAGPNLTNCHVPQLS